jgi:adenosylcobyric acid synthase
MSRAGRVLMVQGTASSVGKSLLVTGLCRLFRREGYRVAPFKAQNMSNNSFVTASGGEIGRAQAVQAEAAGIEPDVRMNPVLLKPEADHRSQAVVMGRPAFTVRAGEFLSRKAELWPVVARALDELRADFDLVVIEGAGSPAEINLRAGDIVNMRVARYAHAPVVLVGDIDRGGVFAHLYGTLALLEPDERALVRGLLVNKFRGDRGLLQPGLEMLTGMAGVPVLGVVPYLRDLRIADEDAVALDEPPRDRRSSAALDIAVIRLPRIANFDDFDPLAVEPDVSLRFVERVDDVGQPDLIILPGTKATIADLTWLRQSGLAGRVTAAVNHGVPIIGICGGYQMLGMEVRDRGHVESAVDVVSGLGVLPIVTDFEPVKATHQVEARVRDGGGLLAGCVGMSVRGYEIHMGRSLPAGDTHRSPPFRLSTRSGQTCEEPDGATGSEGWALGTYLHGLFDNHELRVAILRNLAVRQGKVFRPGVPLDRAAEYDRLADCLRAELNLPLLRQIVGLEAPVWAG